ncbi:MAG TPA: hypothetical protein VMF52_06510 [Steroidobacteraceae bacterium]|nr:hypothetical protein [Steroidobacteraceae bacterium]
MRVGKALGDVAALAACVVAATTLLASAAGLQRRDWQWSSAMLVLTCALSAISVLLTTFSFRRTSRAGLIYVAFALLGANFLLYLIFDRNPLEN